MVMTTSDKSRLVFKMAESGPNLLREVLESKGWIPYIEGETPYWNLSWRGSRYRKSEYEQCQPYQRINHFPNTLVITRKDTLFRLLRTLKGIYGSAYDFFPLTFTVPGEFIRFVRAYRDEEDCGKRSTWICKPVDLSRGRGIFVFRELHELTYDCNAVVQRYIPNPLLISGYKFDMRCYVLVRSFDPLTIYLYEEGLARFATSRFDMTELRNRFSHLTNTSINKFSPTLDWSKDDVGPGCKWEFARLRAYFMHRGVDFGKIWDRIKGIIILTLLPVSHQVTIRSGVCFELYGFDILIDENLKPWLLEVNLSPALSVDASTDILVKRPLLEDIVSLVGITEDDGKRAMKHVQDLASPPLRRGRWISDGKPMSSTMLPSMLPALPINPYTTGQLPITTTNTTTTSMCHASSVSVSHVLPVCPAAATRASSSNHSASRPTCTSASISQRKATALALARKGYPSRVGKFDCIFPSSELARFADLKRPPRVGEPLMKQMDSGWVVDRSMIAGDIVLEESATFSKNVHVMERPSVI